MIKLKSVFALLFIIFATVSPLAAAAASLTELQQAGKVGERPDGLVGIVAADASPDVAKAVEEINQQRLGEYQKIATETSAPIAAVKARAGAQIIARLPVGFYFMDAAGRWRQK